MHQFIVNLQAQVCCHAVQMYSQGVGNETDVLAANEVATHATLQQRQDSQYLYHLLGGFEVQDPDSGKEQAREQEPQDHWSAVDVDRLVHQIKCGLRGVHCCS